MTILSARLMARMKPIIADLERGVDVRRVTINHEMSIPTLKKHLKSLGKLDLLGEPEPKAKKHKPRTLDVDQLKVVSTKYFTGTPLQELAVQYVVPERVIRDQIAANLPDVWDGV